ncbi:MAG: LysR family transcriptional regulator [Elusimicrobia bacterium]|nr:LysR family transcriptional regulator [Elusimicrobiota bacterium]
MIPLNYHHLFYFWTVARAGSIAAAKGRLRLSQPTLSAQLKELERSCRTSLFDRGKKGMSLTAQGRRVFEYCERIFIPGEELAALLENGFTAPPVLHVGIQARVPKEVVVGILEFARSADRRVRVAAFNAGQEELAAGLQRQSFELVVSCARLTISSVPAIRSRLVADLPVAFVASPPIARLVKRFPAQLSRVPMLLRPREHPIRGQVDRYLNARGVVASVEAELEDADVIRRLAVKGRGVAALSLLVVKPDLEAGRLVKLHERRTGIRERVWLSSGRSPSRNPAVRRMVAALMERFRMRE